jgi:hypothetical protein
MGKEKSDFDRALDYAMSEVSRVKDPNLLPAPVRIVVLVHAAQGIIDNGGLQYFFESDFEGQPPYLVFVDAYRAIGADEEAEALALAVKLFPFSEPHKFKERRNEFLQLFSDEGTHGPESPFELTDKLCGNERIWSLLEQYVRKHAESFPA